MVSYYLKFQLCCRHGDGSLNHSYLVTQPQQEGETHEMGFRLGADPSVAASMAILAHFGSCSSNGS